MYGHEEAAALLAAAVDAQRADGTATPLDRYELLMAQADACRWLADRAGLDVALAAAVAEAQRMDDLVRATRAAVATAEGALWCVRSYGRTDQNMIDVLRVALRELPADDSELRCRALLVLANELYYSDAPAYREALVEQGVTMARRLGDPALLVWVCQTGFMAMWRPATAHQRLLLADEAVDVAVRLHDPIWEAVARTLRAIVSAEIGRIDQMRTDVHRAADMAERLRLTFLQIILGELETPWLAMRGRFAEAERRIEQRRQMYASASGLQHKAAAGAADLPLLLWQGRAAEMAQVFRDLRGGPLPMDLILLWTLARAGRIEDARVEHERTGIPSVSDDWGSLFERCQTAEVAFALSLADVARSTYEWLAPYAGRCCISGFGSAIGPVDAFLSLAAAAAGEREIAGRHADNALQLCAEWEIPLVAQWLRDQRERAAF